MAKRKGDIMLALLGAILLTGAAVAAAAQGGVDDRLYAELLQRHVHRGQVDYAGLKRQEEKLDRYLAVLEKVDSRTLGRAQRFAFYINAYNAWTLKLVLTGYPGVTSIKQLGSLFRSPWKKKICRLDGKVMSLDDIEHGILRPRFADPRVHFAVVCAARSCPPLQSVPYRGAVLDAQLDAAARAFINDPRANRFEGGVLYVSRIFKWYAGDFGNDPAGFVARYAGGELKRRLERAPRPVRIAYLEYDWRLNGK